MPNNVFLHRIHDSLIPSPPKLGNNTPAFTTGYRLNGEYFIDERVNIDQTVIGTKFHSLRLVVDNDSNLSTKIFLDKTFIGAFQEHFAPRLKGGVFIVNKFGSVGLFRNFKLNECENEFDGNGNCGKINMELVFAIVPRLTVVDFYI